MKICGKHTKNIQKHVKKIMKTYRKHTKNIQAVSKCGKHCPYSECVKKAH
jgi:hypothetical protein